MRTDKKRFWRIIGILFCVGCLILSLLFSLNTYMVQKVKNSFIEPENITGEYDCILVLGAGVREDGSPSYMLKDRLDKSIELYNAGVANKIIMSGDHGTEDYDEVNTMKAYAVAAGVPSKDIFMDHAGFSTYESLYRARDIFCAESIIIVTQEYHMYRALYVSECLGLDAVGVTAENIKYSGQLYRELRELLARAKDWLYTLLLPEPKIMGEIIPVWGNGNVTNDN